ncbi:MAG: Ig-like domain-containing protein, partial [Gammaproteobacteria bacterium]
MVSVQVTNKEGITKTVDIPFNSSIASITGGKIFIDIDFSAVEVFLRAGDDLVIGFDSGELIVLEDFFSSLNTEDTEQPLLVIGDEAFSPPDFVTTVTPISYDPMEYTFLEKEQDDFYLSTNDAGLSFSEADTILSVLSIRQENLTDITTSPFYSPTAVNDTLFTNESVPIEHLILDNDLPGSLPISGVVSFSEIGPFKGTLALKSDSSISFDPGNNFNTLSAGETESVSFTYTIEDVAGNTDSALVVITITGVNDSPIAIDDTVNTSEDSPILIDVLSNDSDPESDPLTVVAIDTLGTSGSVTLTTAGEVTYTAAESLGSGETATDTFVYTITDSWGETSSAQVTVTVTGTNDGPTAVAD